MPVQPTRPPRRPIWQAALRAASLLTLSAPLWMTLAGCASVEPPSAMSAASQRHSAKLPAAKDLKLSTGVPSRSWWLALGDPRLDALVSQAMQRNPGQQNALAAVRQARAMANLADREGQPQGGLTAQAQVRRPSAAEVDPYEQGMGRPPQQRLATINQMVSWELDLFGRVETASAVARRQAEATEADAHGAEAVLQAEVVRRYIQLRQHQHDELRLTEELELRARLLALQQARERAGLADQQETLAAQARWHQAQASVASARAAWQVERAALAALTGRSPGETDPAWNALLAPTGATQAALPDVPDQAGLVEPSDLLARRPDVARADALLRAALGDTVLAQRAHLPRLSLNLTLGLNSRFGQLNAGNSQRYAVGPALQWDWLDGGRLQARSAAAKAGDEMAWHQFEQTVLQALADSETALRNWQATQAQWQAATQSQQTAEASRDRARKRAAAGLETPTEVLEWQARWLQARRDTVVRQAEALQAYAQVQLALAAWQPEARSAAHAALARPAQP